MSAHHFYRPVWRAGSHIVKGVEREQAIRLYCTQSGETWALQVRGPQMLGMGYTEGKAFMIATASLNLEDMKALRAALDEMIAEAES